MSPGALLSARTDPQQGESGPLAPVVHSLGRLGTARSRRASPPTHHAGVLPATDALVVPSVVYSPAVRPVPISPGALTYQRCLYRVGHSWGRPGTRGALGAPTHTRTHHAGALLAVDALPSLSLSLSLRGEWGLRVHGELLLHENQKLVVPDVCTGVC